MPSRTIFPLSAFKTYFSLAALAVTTTLFTSSAEASFTVSDITDAYQTYSITLGDVNRDGNLDLIIGNSEQPHRIYINQGNGSFDAGTDIDPSATSLLNNAITLGDVNGDKYPDLIAGNGASSFGSTNKLYINDKNDGFLNGSDITSDNDDTHSVVLGDMDNDTDLDLVVGNDGINRLYLNDGKGNFTRASNFPADNQPTMSVALGYINNDNLLDIVVGNYGGGNRYYLNLGLDTTGKVTFDAGHDIGAVDEYTTSVTLGDVDGDSDQDLIAGNDGVNRLYLNNGDGTFDTGRDIAATDNYLTFSVALGDIDNDGDRDLIAGSSNLPVRIYLNDGAGHFSTGSNVGTNALLVGVSLGDVDGDGYWDFVAGYFNSPTRLYHNNGDYGSSSGGGGGGAFGLGLLSLLFVSLLGRSLNSRRRFG